MTGLIFSSSVPVAFSVIPNALGTDGPVMSASSTATDLPLLKVFTASKSVTKDLPTPPFPLMTAIILPIFVEGSGFAINSFFSQV